MMAFAANSLFSRMAVYGEGMEPSLFSVYRTASGAAMLIVLLLVSQPRKLKSLTSSLEWKSLGHWLSGGFLALYMLGFSYSYFSLSAGLGALLLFTTVQMVLLGNHLLSGNKLTLKSMLGYGISLLGIATLVIPRASLAGASAMGMLFAVAAGIGWGRYTLLGKSSTEPLLRTTFAFVIATIVVVLVQLLLSNPSVQSDKAMWLAVCSGAITSACAYAAWYALLPKINSLSAALYQLSVPALTFIGGVIWLNEQPQLLEVVACAATLAGIVITQLPSSTKSKS